MNVTPPPSGPKEWAELYSKKPLSVLPLKVYLSENADDVSHQPESSQQVFTSLSFTKFIQRDIYLDSSRISTSQSTLRTVYADSFAFTQSTIPLSESGALIIYARVLTADSDMTLSLEPASREKTQFIIYTSDIQRTFTFQLVDGPGSQTICTLSAESLTDGVVGFAISIENGAAEAIEKLTYYDFRTLTPGGHLYHLLQTQLRTSNILFWSQQRLALRLATHVAIVTSHSSKSISLNSQANSIANQLIASGMDGNLSYVPPLSLNTYMQPLRNVIEVAQAFQKDYGRFTDRNASTEQQIAAWGTMFGQSKQSLETHKSLAASALEKWKSARDMSRNLQQQMKVRVMSTLIVGGNIDIDFVQQIQDIAINDTKARFNLGISNWKLDQKVKAAIQITGAIMGTFLHQTSRLGLKK
jgi:hypothetical protein